MGKLRVTTACGLGLIIKWNGNEITGLMVGERMVNYFIRSLHGGISIE